VGITVLIIERCYSNNPNDIIHTINVYLLLMEKICGFKRNEASQKVLGDIKNDQVRQTYAEYKITSLRK